MKHKVFLLFWLSIVALCSSIIGILALLGLVNAEVIFWTDPITSKNGKIAWIVGSTLLLILFIVLMVREYRKGNTQ